MVVVEHTGQMGSDEDKVGADEMAVEGKAQEHWLKYRSSFDVPEVGWHLQGKVVVEDRGVAEDRNETVDRQGHRILNPPPILNHHLTL